MHTFVNQADNKESRAQILAYSGPDGREKTQNHSQSGIQKALEQLADFGPRSGRLKQLGRALVHRRR